MTTGGDDEDVARRAWLREQLEAWEREGIVEPATAARIRARHALDALPPAVNRALIVFGVLGGVLIAGGLSLLVAHNWDELGRPARAGLALGLLALAQGVAGLALHRGPMHGAFVEGAATFLVGALGASMALVSQTYNLGGDFADLVLAWLVLALPVPYLLQARVSAVVLWLALLYLPYGRDENFDDGYSFVALGAFLLPFTLWARRSLPTDSRTHVLVMASSFSACVGCAMLVEQHAESLLVAVLLATFGLVRVGTRDTQPTFSSFVALSLGMTSLVGTTRDLWQSVATDLARGERRFVPWIAAAILAYAATLLAVLRLAPGRRMEHATLLAAVPVALLGVALTAVDQLALATILQNAFVLAFGLDHVLRGLAAVDRARTNVGLLVLAGLFLVRFLDEDLSFLARGLGMVAVGIAFLAVNLRLVQKAGEARR